MAQEKKHRRLWLLWGALSLGLGTYLAAGITLESAAVSPWRATARALLLPGATSGGHYQIELACNTCHRSAFGGKEALQQACVGCHGAELKEARDSHPRSKFTDPRNADRAARLDAAVCVTCHVEHRPRITRTAGVTLPGDYCVICHDGIAKERPTHAGLGFETCAGSGCHNFHDNRALYGDFLVKHARQPELLERRRLRERDFLKVVEELSDYPIGRYPLKALGAQEMDAGSGLRSDPKIIGDWLATSHARAGVNCSACHRQQNATGAEVWVEQPDHRACSACHGPEVKGFLAGKHGMRLDQGLPPMSPALARLPMRQDAHDRSLGCASCHAAHRFDTRRAAVEACLACHSDNHSLAYRDSPHYRLWQRELAGELPAGSGVSCAGCHLPRVPHRTPDDVTRTLVQHNQNDNLLPSEKMIRSACLECHGLRFSIDALADRALAARNFNGRPAAAVKSIDMALEVERRAEAGRRQAGERGRAGS